ncbi:Serine/threonine-protein kinase pkn1 [Bordetella trematum]|uniref:Serine/threonine-protein kinase pkn1 n=1 Tax=Bordetella trematum TaxID=123899 RepID=A0A157NCC5_9BORD|nr:SUMF1/EgtB/PvdO family nonheme iron enzyme [Bordetella trematum]SAI18995.1 Serine/threonine-protein kinase pkn1 [Bordetella trematum]SAI22588.1 Serine/threonine-protein kinase pkn1 [Bordetella trematum]SAI70740.1 Serine/threonine-protein kinase pkn1 [Bordetella trematum]SUV98601.1 Serine/threonine-protein kinase pkn1 [Bordetella trematum]
MKSESNLPQAGWRVLAVAMGLMAGSAVHAAEAAKWDTRYTNPKPAAGDVVLPLPCGGELVFRKVVVPSAGPLDDLPVMVGQESEQFAFVEQRRQAHIAGSFTEQGKGAAARYYLMAKYELTGQQYQALKTLENEGKGCEAPSRKGMLPVTGVSWFEAVNLAHRYSVWLRQHHKNALPKEDGITGFVRLPTEVEWEFAARGGANVDPAAYAELRYPMPEGVQAHEWYGGAQSSNGKLQLVGLLAPNPLGLHDMLGNAAEMTQDAFRLNKLDRQHGGAGAYVIRGGDFRKPEDGIRSAARREGNFYSEDGEQLDNAVGMRWVVAAPEMTSRERIQQLEQSWRKLGSGDVSNDAAGKGRAAVQELGELAGKVEDAKLKEQLKELEGKLRASNQRQEEARDQAIRASLNLGAFLCTKLRDDGRYVQFVENTYKELCEASADSPECVGYKGNIDKRRYELAETTQYYASSLVDAATLYGKENIARQMPVISRILEQNEKLKGLQPYLNVYWGHQQAYLKSWKINKDAWLAACVEAVKN